MAPQPLDARAGALISDPALRSALQRRLEEALPEFLLRQRWYPAKDAGRPRVVLVNGIRWDATAVPALVAIWRVMPPERDPMLLFVPFVVVPAEAAKPTQLIATLAPEGGGGPAWAAVDAFSHDEFVQSWVRLQLDPDTGALESLRVGRTAQADAVRGELDANGRIRRGGAEQSNTSMRIGDAAVLKVFRRLEPGVHPELEIGRFLTERGFEATPALLSWVETAGSNGASGCTLSVLQSWVQNEGDGWSWMLAKLPRLAGSEGSRVAQEIATWVRALARRTAEMHRVFAAEPTDPAFRPEPVGASDRAAWADAARAMAERAFSGLGAAAAARDSNTRQLAAGLQARQGSVLEKIEAVRAIPSTLSRTRHHGDYHLGQVLVRGADAVILDFEGEPLRPLAQRRAKHSPLRDVAGMLRSFSYAAEAAARAGGQEVEPLRERLHRWRDESERLFLDAYLEDVRDLPAIPADREQAKQVLRFFLLEKALYEVAYELANRPDWVGIPLRAVLELIDETDAPPLALLAERLGIQPEFRNAHGEIVRTTPDTQRALLRAMGLAVGDDASARAELEALERAQWTTGVGPVQVTRKSSGPLTLELVFPHDVGEVSWTLSLESGAQHAGRAPFESLTWLAERDLDGRRLQRRRLQLPLVVPWGYHQLQVEPGGTRASWIITPERCWLAPALEQGARLWGIAAQLYLLRSASNWGIGDFGDLRKLVELGAREGADVIGLNPLHAMFSDNPEHASPYSPASRVLLNILNIDVTAAMERFPAAQARELVRSPSFQRELQSCRSQPLVDYASVASLKLRALRLLFDSCRADAQQGPWEAFQEFREKRGWLLEQNCRFLALREHFAAIEPACADWHAWPREYRDPRSAAVQRFAKEHPEAIEFIAWLQWVADQQLGAVAALVAGQDQGPGQGQSQGMRIGLYRDLAVGADRAGAETWVDSQAVVSGAHVGAPPDIFNPAGQDWGLPPFNPSALRREGYRSFIDLVRANMRHAGGLRIDHVMGLQQLYWVPEGASPSGGAYVRYPIEDLVGILALESHRHRCLVVGEDLGTVPENFRERMAEANILSYRVLFFEQDAKTGAFIPPADYPRLALAVSGSHDLPTLRGWWEGRDIELKEQLGLFPTPEAERGQRESRRRDRAELVQALRQEGLLPADGEPDVSALARAVHAFLARTRSMLALAQLDDLTDEADPVNVPATSEEHPNWRRRMSVSLEELPRSRRFLDISRIFAAERGKR